MAKSDFIVLKYVLDQLDASDQPDPLSLARLMRKASGQFKVPTLSKPQLLQAYHILVKQRKLKPSENIEKLLCRRPIRTLSGVAIITVLTKPFKCPGRCLYCPDEKGMPKSYLKSEPAAHRAYLTKFSPYMQVKTRLDTLAMNGHPTDKIELIVLGGTWSAYPKRYQSWFIQECFRACNEKAKGGAEKLTGSFDLVHSRLKEQQKRNERAKHRIVGLTLETRPDYVDLKEIIRLRDLGCTRVELGVQSIYDNVLKINRRDHSVAHSIQATKLLKDAGFKINYHIMLNLPGSSYKKDLAMFDQLFSNPDWQPDLLKIYPCMVLKTADLFKEWKKGGYKPYKTEQLINLIMEIKKKIPYYVRIQRIIRDIPAFEIEAGSAVSNIRQIIDQSGKKVCSCIRCREIKGAYHPKTQLKLFRKDYLASGGKEIFLSFEDKQRKHLYALLRLRLPSVNEAQLVFLKEAALIREVHTYGQLLALAKKESKYTQHKGLGKKLMKEAESIVKKEFKDYKAIAVISGIGVRGYYRKLGYKLQNEYMVKKI